MTTPAEKEQQRRRTILIGVKNLFQKKIENWSTIWKRADWSYIKLIDVYNDLENFLYGKDIIWLPYLVSIEELDYYVNLYREIDKNDKKFIEDWFKNS